MTDTPRATYRLDRTTVNEEKGFVWTDLAEANPRGRARLRADSTIDWTIITVLPDGRLSYNPDHVEVDYYDQEAPATPE